MRPITGPRMAYHFKENFDKAKEDGASVKIKDNVVYVYATKGEQVFPSRREILEFLSFVRKNEWTTELQEEDYSGTVRSVWNHTRKGEEDSGESV